MVCYASCQIVRWIWVTLNIKLKPYTFSVIIMSTSGSYNQHNGTNYIQTIQLIKSQHHLDSINALLFKVSTNFLWEIEKETYTFLFIWQILLLKCFLKLGLIIIMQEYANTWTLFGLFLEIKKWCVWTCNKENGNST